MATTLAMAVTEFVDRDESAKGQDSSGQGGDEQAMGRDLSSRDGRRRPICGEPAPEA